MADRVNVQFHADAKRVGWDRRAEEGPVIPPVPHSGLGSGPDTPIDHTNNRLLEAELRAALASANTPYDSRNNSYASLEIYDELLNKLHELEGRGDHQNQAGNRLDRSLVELLSDVGGDIYKHAESIGDYRTYAKFLKYVNEGELLKRSHEGYEKWAHSREIQFLQALDTDPVVKQAKRSWSSLTKDDKLNFARYVHNLQAGFYDFLPDQISAANFNGQIMSGLRVPLDIKLNSSTILSQSPFTEFMSVVTHESMHTLQEKLIARYNQIETIEQQVLTQMQISGYEGLKTDAQKQQFQKLVKDQISASGISTPWDDHLGFYGDFYQHMRILSLPYVNHMGGFDVYGNHIKEIEAYGVQLDVYTYLMNFSEGKRDILHDLAKGAHPVSDEADHDQNTPPIRMGGDGSQLSFRR